MLRKAGLLAGALCLLIGAVALSGNKYVSLDVRDFLAATFFIQSVTADDLREKFEDVRRTGDKVRVLVVPGHEPDFGGAEFGSLKEREMNVFLAGRLAEHLKDDKRFEVVLTRSDEGWNKELEEYFEDEWEAIKDFAKLKKEELEFLVEDGRVQNEFNGIYHNSVPNDVALRLFGINRWSRDIGADILVHVHFNDYPRARAYSPGKYKGFAIYVPNRQYSNAKASRAVAESVLERLSGSFAVSDLPKEEKGIVESMELIAIGQSNTLDAPSLLIEYGYIYRPVFQSQVSREETLTKMAELTYLGLLDFFES